VLVGELPSPAWGRDELATGEIWSSNSVIAWLLAPSGLPTDAIRPPAGGRPGMGDPARDVGPGLRSRAG
jgi:hypothetical protein